MSKEPTTLLDVIHVIRQLADKLEAMAETMTEREVQTFEQVYPPEEGNTEAVQKPVSVKDSRPFLFLRFERYWQKSHVLVLQIQ